MTHFTHHQGSETDWRHPGNFCPQVDLESPKKITGVITQGAKDFGSVQFVSAFKVAHSLDGRSWNIVQDSKTKTDQVWREGHKRQRFRGQFPDVMSCCVSTDLPGKQRQQRPQDEHLRATTLRPLHPPAALGVAPANHTAAGAAGLQRIAPPLLITLPFFGPPLLPLCFPCSLPPTVKTQDRTVSPSAAGGSKQQGMPENTATYWTDQG